MSRQFGVDYGISHPSIAEQLKKQGLSAEGVDSFEAQRNAINTLAIAELIPQKQVQKALQKLHKRLTKRIEWSLHWNIVHTSSLEKEKPKS